MSLAHPEDDFDGLEDKLRKLREEAEDVRAQMRLYTNKPYKKDEYRSPLHYPPSDCDSLIHY